LARSKSSPKPIAGAEAGKPAGRGRKVREDARRNREMLIDTAKAAFAELGPDVSLEAIARNAGVGIGTLYRHFPTRHDLVEAVCRHEVQQLAEAAPRLLAKHGPSEALRRWMRLCIDYIATKKIMAAVVCSIFGMPDNLYTTSAAQITDNPLFGAKTELYRSSTELIKGAISSLTESAAAAGEIRPDADSMDLIRALAGFTVTYGDDTGGWKSSALRLTEILMDGLRTPAAIEDRDG
jgi:AcrR family transcriptional regulator